jgi:hypothetical protein
MLKKVLIWALAVIITLAAGVYQRVTGPTYPVDGNLDVDGHLISYSLPRSHNGDCGQIVAVKVGGEPIQGILHYKRHEVTEPFHDQDMLQDGDSLYEFLPHQPPAGKLEYYVTLHLPDTTVYVPGQKTVVIRFTGAVPLGILIAHVFFIFLGMLWSNRTGLEALTATSKTKSLTLVTVVLLFLGGLVFGPIVQKFAFGQLWTGVPFGWDLTDNKTLIFVVVWGIALWRHRYSANPRYIVLAAALVTIIMYLIPHSVLGSTLDYNTGQVTTG